MAAGRVKGVIFGNQLKGFKAISGFSFGNFAKKIVVNMMPFVFISDHHLNQLAVAIHLPVIGFVFKQVVIDFDFRTSGQNPNPFSTFYIRPGTSANTAVLS